MAPASTLHRFWPNQHASHFGLDSASAVPDPCIRSLCPFFSAFVWHSFGLPFRTDARANCGVWRCAHHKNILSDDACDATLDMLAQAQLTCHPATLPPTCLPLLNPKSQNSCLHSHVYRDFTEAMRPARRSSARVGPGPGLHC